jgi:1,6-anhydro-N-acetylmuramate kinase
METAEEVMAAVEMTEPNRRSFAVRGGAIENRERIMQRGRLARRAEMAVANQRSAALRSGVIDKRKTR